MRAEIKSISNDEFYLESFRPDDPKSFFLTLRMRIGREGTATADDFELLVCSPGWLLKNTWQPTWGRHMLIVHEYDFHEIERFIHEYVDRCEGANWVEVATK
ncbi:Imm8 family immunity protein, partial [Pandoraea sp. ISTKB]|uniref:Imm8 family immunity protein n=1 Tax=Pandoraea sp. ISTKB TaxID=1586708 RepID=UPI0009F23375